MAKPRRLTFRKSPRRTLRVRDCSLKRHLAAQVAKQFAQPDRFHCRQIGSETAAGEHCRLAEHVCFDHPHKPGVAGAI
jgi:hypothetical protein